MSMDSRLCRRHWSLKMLTEVLGTGHMRGEECDELSEIREGQSDRFRRIDKGREDGFIRNPKRKRCQRLDVSNEGPMRRSMPSIWRKRSG